MEFNELEKNLFETESKKSQILNPTKFDLEELYEIVPSDSQHLVYEIFERLGNPRETAYAVLISTFYEPQEEALETIKRLIPPTRDRKINKSRYEMLKEGFLKRVRMKSPHSVHFLEAELEAWEYTDSDWSDSMNLDKKGPGAIPNTRDTGKHQGRMDPKVREIFYKKD